MATCHKRVYQPFLIRYGCRAGWAANLDLFFQAKTFRDSYHSMCSKLKDGKFVYILKKYTPPPFRNMS